MKASRKSSSVSNKDEKDGGTSDKSPPITRGRPASQRKVLLLIRKIVNLLMNLYIFQTRNSKKAWDPIFWIRWSWDLRMRLSVASIK